jgi:CelD/BcsL family acetyltransferase involved in cellulose biosynthesis
MTAAIKLDPVLGLDLTVYDTEAQLVALGPEWDGLRARVSRYSGAQGHAFVLAAWQALPKTPDVRLAVIAARRDGALVGLWPLYVSREGGHTVACHLGAGSREEYAGPLLQDLPPDREAGERILQTAKGLGDVLRAYNLFVPGLAAEILAADGNFRRTSTALSPVVNSCAYETHGKWTASLSKKLRTELRTDRRRAARQGELTLERITGPEAGPACVDWIFAHKRRWLADHGVRTSWMFEDQGRDLYAALISQAPSRNGHVDDVEAHALKLDGRIIAASIALNGPDRVEVLTAAQDPMFNDASPGSLLLEDRTIMAIARGVVMDLRLTREAYKLRWADGSDRLDSFMIACTLKGQAAVALEIVAKSVRRVRVIWGPRIKSLLKRRRA